MIKNENYHFELKLPDNFAQMTVRELMHNLLLPKTMQHDLRTQQNILVNNQYRSMNQMINPGDLVEFIFPKEVQSQHYQASGIDPEIVFEDENLLVINKPASQKTHPTKGNETDTAINDATNYLQKNNQEPFIVHRLDKNTTGLLLFAKNPIVVPILNRQLANKTMKREYRALVDSDAKIPDSGKIELPIAHHPTDTRRRIVAADGLPATTHYRVLAQSDSQSLLELTLETGRTHQIRVHLAANDHPIIGDELYHPKYLDNEKAQLQLQAIELELIKPFSFDKLLVKLPESEILSIKKSQK